MSYAERIGAIRHLGYAMADAVLGAAQIASEADDVIAAKDAEIARLRESLNLALDEIRECDDSEGVRGRLRVALAHVAEVGK